MLFSALLVQTLALTPVHVIDGTTAVVRASQTVIIRENRIIQVGPATATPIPPDARVISTEGLYLVPGLWDLHVHLTVPGGREVLPLYVANGVTGVRTMGDQWDSLVHWRREISSGGLVGPRIVAAGPYIEGGDVVIPHLLARNPEEAEQTIDSLLRLGVDFAKLHSQLRRETFLAALRLAQKRGLRTAGHVPRNVSALEASDSGLGSIEHLLQIPAPCTPAESLALLPRFPTQEALGRCSSADLTALFAKLARNGTWVVPTLVAQYEIARWPKRDLPGDSFSAYLPDKLRQYVAAIFPMPDSIPEGADSVGMALFQKRVAVAGALYRAGVGVLPGTDAPLRNSPPGFGLHRELVLLAQAGLSPFEVLRAATPDAARFLGLADSLGRIAAGQLADLILLEANPLEDVRNLQRIKAVVANGRWLSSPPRVPR
ncbi:MAG: amidohydrolase [Nitrospiraceae bacterium]|nr:MAG: amidohydrolase [Nitrospiraceae bacterium]